MPILPQNSRPQIALSRGRSKRRTHATRPAPAEPPIDAPLEPEEPDDVDEIDLPCTDEADWEVFIPDHDFDPLPEHGDFWNDELPDGD